jgi:UDP-glucose 4-epimerase
VFDFYRQLLADPTRLAVLGDGTQRKSYLYVQDCIDAILFALERPHQKIHVYNLGAPEYCQVSDSIGWITAHLGVKPQLAYSGGSRGWVGDNKFIFLDTARIATLGWKPKLTIRQGIVRTVDWLTQNRWVMDRVK